MNSLDTLETEKQRLRAKARARRAAIPTDDRKRAAERVAGVGLDFLRSPPDILAAYHPVRSELDCLPLLHRLASDGWRPALPVVVGAAPLIFREWSFSAPLETGPLGIPHLSAGPEVIPRVLIVPLLAFDRRGYRLGYGGGHYDRTLAALRQDHAVTAVGLAFDEQEVAEVPSGPYDQPLDWILTPSGPIQPAPDARHRIDHGAPI
ncbi:MAG TPA: 5-formyltetrahydrofolate cyclo-ligase [Hyphomicrobiales bacterium]|jgi:5-formyltetrahydrofolate cyclo-ligase